MKKYEANEDSDIEWVSSIPMNWKVIPAKALWKVRKEPVGDNASPEDLMSVSEYYGVAPRAKKIDSDETLMRAESLDGYQLCYPGDLVMNIMLAWKGAQGISAYEGIVSPSYVVYKPICSHDICPRYFHYLLRCDTYKTVFKRWSTGIIDSRLRLYPEAFLRIPLLLPPKSVQEAIATFLDTKTTEIDSLIVKTERSIKLLEEYRKSVISGAVTKGLDPDTPMKDSGIDWIGKMPEHWSISKVKYEFTNHDSLRRPVEASLRSQDSENLYPYYGASGIVDTINDYIFDGRRILIGEDGANLALRNLPLVYVAEGKYWVNNHAHVLEPSGSLDFDYAAHQLELIDLADYITGSAQPKLSQANLGRIPVAVPPMEEQRAIVRQVNSSLCSLVESINTKRLLTERLKEYRESLIYEAVTGKIKISGADQT